MAEERGRRLRPPATGHRAGEIAKQPLILLVIVILQNYPVDASCSFSCSSQSMCRYVGSNNSEANSSKVVLPSVDAGLGGGGGGGGGGDRRLSRSGLAWRHGW
ncbi:hypothetical protein GUJ93_ZPchr0001g31738 [Zizania palustris]|uniref:Uncharacterized protein n=1 Tax=Zizania palustris TaxID=103762 RepID=A0A8J5RP39_ZIZPA|nr:hypothetical protein GUJ93_ZPchr0001g31738 [Zizania palustris]